MKPDFVIIGAMKCGTSTLAAQLAAQPGVFMTGLTEPNFFSDDAVYARGTAWYASLFDGAPEGALKGEVSTHYTKLPTYPRAAERLHDYAPHAKLIYLRRDPVERLISHYMHEWTENVFSTSISQAIEEFPELVDYGRYEMQLRPWRSLFAPEQILCLSLENMRAAPQETLEQVAAFLGRPGAFCWQEERAHENASVERIRQLPLQRVLIDHPLSAGLRRTLVPQTIRAAIKRRLQLRQRPQIPDELLAQLQKRFADG